MFLRTLLVLCCFAAMRLHANCCGDNYSQPYWVDDSSPWYCCNNDCWYGVVGAGYAFSLDADIQVDLSVWSASSEGYTARLGNASYVSIGAGKTFCDWLNFDAVYSIYQPFHYQKFQSGPDTIPSGFPGNPRTRFFDLEHQSVMFNFSLDPRWQCLHYELACIDISPIVGVGIGAGINRVANFHTVGFNTTTPPVGSVSSIGRPITTSSFAWQVNAALRFQKICSNISFDIGYRYHNGGRFKGPSTIVANTADEGGGFLEIAPWKGWFRTNEVYLNMNFWF